MALISNSAQLIAENKAIKQQAESATRTASALLDNQAKDTAKKPSATDKEDGSVEKANEELSALLKERNEEVAQLNKSLKIAKIDLEAMKKQSENLTKAYDDLSREHAKIQAKLEYLENGGSDSSGGKKDN